MFGSLVGKQMKAEDKSIMVSFHMNDDVGRINNDSDRNLGAIKGYEYGAW